MSGFDGERTPYPRDLDCLVNGFLKGTFSGLMASLTAGRGSLSLAGRSGEDGPDRLSGPDHGRGRTERDGGELSIGLESRGETLGVMSFSGGDDGLSGPESKFALTVGRMASRIVTDLGELSRARRENAVLRDEKELMERFAAVGKMAAGLMPGINESLSIMSGSVEELSVYCSSDTSRRYLREIRQGLKRIGRSIAALMEEPGEPGPLKGNLDLGRVLDESIDTLKVPAERRVRISRDYGHDLPPVPDVGLEHVFVNIIKNALEAMPDGGELEIFALAEKQGVRINFTDTGTGIPAGFHDRIFDPFFTTKERKGSGLGLSISREIVSACGGEIGVKSVPGKGTRFTVFIPLAKLVPEKV